MSFSYGISNCRPDVKGSTFDDLGLVGVELLEVHDEGVRLETRLHDPVHDVGQLQLLAPAVVHDVEDAVHGAQSAVRVFAEQVAWS